MAAKRPHKYTEPTNKLVKNPPNVGVENHHVGSLSLPHPSPPRFACSTKAGSGDRPTKDIKSTPFQVLHLVLKKPAGMWQFSDRTLNLPEIG